MRFSAEVRASADEQQESTRDTIQTVEEVARELRCSKAQVYKLIRGEVKGSPRLPAISLGRKRIVRRSSLEAWKLENESRGSLEITDGQAYPFFRTSNERR